MKSPFFWRIVICLVPTLAALVVNGNALKSYLEGRGGFKLGVDLVGGTILVYEIDPDKKPKDYKGGQELAVVLKRRLDPTDIYNVTVRPVGGERVEIILPTGGKHQSDVAEGAWQDLLLHVKDKWRPDSDTAWPELIAKVKERWPNQEGYDSEVPKGNLVELARLIKKNNPNDSALVIAKFLNQRYATNLNAGRGRMQELADLVKDQDKDKKGNDQEVADFIKEGYKIPPHLTGEEVEKIKDKIKRQGSLEFRILANEENDREAIEAARKWFEAVKDDPKRKADLDALSRAGKPPPPPNDGKPFETPLGKFTYSWVELGKKARIDLMLTNSDEKDTSYDEKHRARRNSVWPLLEAARKEGKTIRHPEMPSQLFYSRNVTNPGRLAKEEQDKRYEYFVLTRDPEKGKEVTGQYLNKAAADSSSKGTGLSVHFGFNTQGGQLFYELTSKNKKQQLAIVLDGKFESSATINEAIRHQGEITGNYTPEEAKTLVDILKSGALPATLKPTPVSEDTIGSTLGDDTIKAGATAVLLAYLAVIVFMLIYYRFAGLVACVALLANLLITVAVMVLVSATFTLPGLAGLVLMLGMAVDANVLIYERLREERDRGASLALAIRNGYDRAFPTIIDTHLSSIFTAIVLFVVGNDQLKGFGISLTLGLVISLFTSLYMTRLLFDLCLAKGWLRNLSMMRLFSKPNIDFMGIRYYWFTATILLTIFGLTVFLVRGRDSLNIDFTGGTAYTGQLVKMMDIKELRDLLNEKSQAEKLKGASAVPQDPRSRSYEIIYADGDKEDVTLSEPATPENIKANPKLLNDLRNEPDLPVRPIKEANSKDPNAPATIFRITYSDGQKRDVTLPNAATTEEVTKRAQELPDLSVQQIFGSARFSQGNASRLFTVRTSEKAPELVQASIIRLLGNDLARIELKSFQIEPNNKDAILEFADFVSPTQVRNVLERKFKQLDDKRAKEDKAKLDVNFTLDKVDKNDDEDNKRLQRMRLQLTQALDRADFEAVLKDTQEEMKANSEPESLKTFDTVLARDTQEQALYAILASWGAILLYLWFRFGNWTFGMAAVLCLVHDLLFTLGIIAFCHYIHHWVPGFANMLGLHDFKIDLASVAALLTLVGYSVNDTIVVFDRIREVRGKNPELTPQMINDSVNQALSRTVLTSLTVWLVVFVLYCFGGEGVHLFAFVMVVGVVVGTYSSIYIASPLLLIFGEGTRPAGARERQPQPVGRRG